MISALRRCYWITRSIIQGKWGMASYQLSMWRQGVDLRGVSVKDLGFTEDRSNWYSDSGGPALARVLKQLPISTSDEAIDIGCGKGGAILTLQRFPFARVDGIELSNSLAQTARDNLRVMHVMNSEIFCGDAAHFTELDRYTFFYLYNPFSTQVMCETIKHICESLARRRRRAMLIYKNPVDHDLLIEVGFQLVSEFPSGDRNPFFVYVIDPLSGRSTAAVTI